MAIKTSWTAGEVLASADISDTLASKMSYALPTNVQTGTTYTAVLADANKLTTLDNASPIAVTIPPQSSVAWLGNTVLRYTSLGAGVVTFAGGAGVTVTNTAGTLAQYQSADVIRTGSDAWTVLPFAGGSAKATVSGTTGSPTITTVSGKTLYDFTGSGSITIGTSGLCTLLVIGGGGSGGVDTGGGGGGGGVLYSTTAYLPSGALTVSVGSGASGVTSPLNYSGRPGLSGNSSAVGSYFAPGGGGGGAEVFVYSNTNGYATNGNNGGSGGGGGGGRTSTGAAGGNGISPLGYGGGTGYNDTGSSSNSAGGGGGGAGAAGANASSAVGGAGGNGISNSITGSAVTYGGGGGGGNGTSNGSGGTGGGGAGVASGTPNNGSANLGGGGGAQTNSAAGQVSGAGGSGRVLILIG